MKLRTLAAVAAVSVSMFAGAAFADGRIAAALDAPVPAKTKVVAGGAVFVCEGSECVSAFGGETRSLDAEDLTRCNASAKGAALASAK